MVRKVGKYELHKTLGHGSFGKVKLAFNTENKTNVAIKVVDREEVKRQQLGPQLKQEISVLKKLNHPCIIELQEVLASDTKIFIVFEHLANGELFEKIIKQDRLKPNEARKYFRQLIDGLEYCHNFGVCHRDLKPENLLLDSDNNLKISDFGLSAMISDDDDVVMHTTCGTPNYVAPEVLMDKGYLGPPADIWSAGVILYVMLAGFLPFDEPTMAELFRKIVKAEVAFPKWFEPDAINLICGILNPDAKYRFKIEHIKAHEWYRLGYDDPPINPSPLPIPELLSIPSSPESERHISITREDGLAMNAFDLINMVGFAAMNRMFRTENNETAKAFTRFSSNLSLERIIHLLRECLSLNGISVKQDGNTILRCNEDEEEDGKNKIAFTVRIYEITSKLRLVSFTRKKGDSMLFHQLYTDCKKHIANFTNENNSSSPLHLQPPDSPINNNIIEPPVPVRKVSISSDGCVVSPSTSPNVT